MPKRLKIELLVIKKINYTILKDFKFKIISNWHDLLKVTEILLNWWILLVGGARGIVCVD